MRFFMISNSKILVVDDDRDLCDLIHEILSEEGYDVSKTYDGDEALKKLKDFDYDLLIIDHKLKGTTGISVIKKLINMKPPPKILMISAYGTAETKEQAIKNGVFEFIDKPFEINKLTESVKMAICN